MSLSSGQEITAVQKRPITVADLIRATWVAGSGHAGVPSKSGFAVFSPDGTRFALVVAHGNLETDANDYSLIVFRTSDVFNHGTPTTIASLSSSSNREGISRITWSEDNDTIFFLGTQGEDTTQLYSIHCGSRKLTKLTNHATSLSSYTVSESGNKIVYEAEKAESDVITEKVRRYGLRVSREAIWDLIRGHTKDYGLELLVQERRSASEKLLVTTGLLDSGVNDLFLSPNGRYLVVKTDAMEIPQSWSEYEDVNIQQAFRIKPHKGYGTRVLQYELIDTRSGKSEVLLDSPATYAPADVLWSPDSESVLLCGVYLPLDVTDPIELQSRRSRKFVVEIDLPGRSIITVAADELTPVYWNRVTNTVRFREQGKGDQERRDTGRVYYRKVGAKWERVKSDPGEVIGGRPEVLIDEGPNLPPRIVAVDSMRIRKAVVLNLNPQFAQLAFGKVEEIHWSDSAGNHVSGGLYLPPDYRADKRYPLVIQTHGFDPNGFWIDGPYRTAFAAQPLVSNGIVVLQVDDIFFDSVRTPREPERAMSAYESAVQYLNQKGIIDRNRVGLIGFSRTCLYVLYALTHSSQHFAAAIAADGYDGGYLQYLVSYNENADSDADSVIGARPFGAGLSVWMKRSPGFSLDKVRTPVQLQALEPASLLGEWEWFSGLNLLEKPVDLVYLPTGTHMLVNRGTG
jgi:dipeptidyl aminopeptidase/acylaminoacyl peptidase